MTLIPRSLWSPWASSARELLGALNEVTKRHRRPYIHFGQFSLVTIGGWFVYVPLHELLHAYGCLAAGGTVGELQIKSLYGGKLLEKVFPFVRAGGEYAGRLTRFDTHGSDLIYLATDYAPYLLTLFGALPLVSIARRRGSVLMLGLGAVLAIAPLVGLTGDFYEMGSIVVSAGVGLLLPTAPDSQLLALRHDDLVALIGEFGARFPDHRLAWGTAVVGSSVLGFMLAGATLAASRQVAIVMKRFAKVRGRQ